MLLLKPQPGRRIVCGVVASFVCALGISGCGMAAPSTAQVRIVDASAGTGSFDVFAGSGAIAYNLGFGTVTSYVPAAPATYGLTINAAGTTHAMSTVKASLVAGKQYTMLIHGAATAPEMLADQSQPAPPGEIALRFLHESRSVGSMDLYLVPPSATLATLGSLPVAQGISYGGNSGYLNVAAGRYTLYMVPHGTALSTETVALFTGAATSYMTGSASTVVILDAQSVSATPVSVTTLPDYTPVPAAQ